ncbi:MAG TPA: chemotaxis protein CheX [Bryobacteraceae bacterium]|nr:chemotaxis protein CheX [Bryobacteraceae bacterium]
MEPNEIQVGLAAAVEEVLETMCFTSVLASGEGAAPAGMGAGHRTASVSERTSAGSEETVPDAAARSCTAELHFEGNPSGGCRVSVPLKLARVVGAGFLGSEEMEVSDSQAEEVVCELANMICGSVLSRLESEETFRITHPQLVPPERGAGFENAAINRWFDLGDGILTVTLELQPAI